MNQNTYLITFEGLSAETANKYAAELGEILADTSRDVRVERKREDPDAQDLGGTLVLILGTGAAIALAKGLADWLRKRNDATVTVTKVGPKGTKETMKGTGLTSKDAARMLEIFTAE